MNIVASITNASKIDLPSGSWLIVSGKNIMPPAIKTTPTIASWIFMKNSSKVVFSEPN